MNNVEKAIALLRENIETVPPHGCQRDEVLALLIQFVSVRSTPLFMTFSEYDEPATNTEEER